MFDDGSGYDLRSLVGKDDPMEAVTDKQVTFFFSPCGDTKLIPGTNKTAINGYMLSMFNKTDQNTTILGNEANMEFKMNGENLEMIFTKSQPSQPTVKHSVTLECVPKTKVDVLYAPSGDKDEFVSF